MILSLAVLWLGLARADDVPLDPVPPAEAEEDPLSPYRVRFDVLAGRTIGTTSRPVAFNWRRTHVQLGAIGSYLVELNNFNSMRAGALVRLPSRTTVVEIGLAYAGVWDSPSSEALAYTPYRQPGRPDRLDLDVAVGLPLAEGVVTVAPRFFPAVEMVFVAYGGVRYHLYPTAFGGLRPGQVAGALIGPRLSDAEIENLDGARLDAMQIDRGRYGLLAGFGNDLYFKSGVFLSPRLLIAAPLLAPASETELLLWADLSLAIGVAL